MAQRRMVYAKIWDSDQFNRLAIHERLLYIALITVADDEGCFRSDAKHLKRIIFYQDKKIGIARIEQMLQRIINEDLIVIDEIEKGRVGFHPNWHQHQYLRADRSKASPYSQILVANGRTPRFQTGAEGKVSEFKLSKGSEATHTEKMRLGFEQAKQKLTDQFNIKPSTPEQSTSQETDSNNVPKSY